MKFKINVSITSSKQGLELYEEQERLGFEKKSSAGFVKRISGITVSVDFAKKHRGLFEDSNTAYLMFDSSLTSKEDYEDWGSAGHVLSPAVWGEEKIEQMLEKTDQ